MWFVLGAALIVAALGLVAFNMMQDRAAGEQSGAAASQLASGMNESLTVGQVISPDTPMPVREIDGNLYVGIVRIPSLGVELPVMSECEDGLLEISPCRYAGSVYADNMVIAGHNYVAHFGNLDRLRYGDEVSFVDVRGNVFVYEVSSVETLGADEVGRMTESEWDLTLFTCTWSGASRVTVRCSEVLV